MPKQTGIINHLLSLLECDEVQWLLIIAGFIFYCYLNTIAPDF